MANWRLCDVFFWLVLSTCLPSSDSNGQMAWPSRQASNASLPSAENSPGTSVFGVSPTAGRMEPAAFTPPTNQDMVRELLDTGPNPSIEKNLTESAGPAGWSRLSDLPISFGSEWLTDAQTGLTTYDASFKFPILKLFGSPPPIVKSGWAFTDFSAGPRFELPRELYEYSVSVSQVYRLNDRWTVRSMLGVAMATDHFNRSSDAWQFRGGVFGIYQASEQWQWTVGAIALGRDDLPAVPALGAIWTPSPAIRWDLIPPDPKFNWMFSETASRQNWLYLGGGFDGTTWGYRTLGGENDRLTYGDLRLVAGWQSTPRGEPGVPYVRGRKYNVEIGYVFSRDLEFNQEQTEISLDDAWLIRLETRY